MKKKTKSDDEPFSAWLKQLNKRFKQNSEFFEAVFDFTDMKRNKSRSYKQ